MIKIKLFLGQLFTSKLRKEVEELKKRVSELEAINKREEERRLNNKKRYGNKKSI